MKRGRILLGIVVLVGIVAFVVSAQFGYTAQKEQKPGAVPGAQGQPPLKCEKCGCWKIVSMEAKPDCYKVPPCDAKEDFKFSFTVDLKAASLPPCDLVIEASSKTCQYESGIQPPLNLTGVSGWVTWGGAKMNVKRLSKDYIQLYFPEYFVSCKCDGTSPVSITLTAHSMCGKKAMCKPDTRTLTVPPCPFVGKCCVAGKYEGTAVDDLTCAVGPGGG
jgi:hypothetical protein